MAKHHADEDPLGSGPLDADADTGLRPPNARSLTPRMMVLGIVVAEEECSVSRAARQLDKLFPSACWHRGAAHNNLERMEQQGLVELVSKGKERGDDRYRATQKGRDHFNGWFHGPLNGPPRRRDHLRAWLAFVITVQDLDDRIERVRTEIEACQERYEEAHRAALAKRDQTAGKRQHWRVNLITVNSLDEVTVWHKELDRLQDLLARLREVRKQAADQTEREAAEGPSHSAGP